MEEKENIFKKLSAIDCSQHVEKKNNLTYLSWAWAWGIAKTHYPSANYKVNYFDGKPYLFDENLGYIVSTEVTIDGETIPMHLPIMDGANKAMKSKPYTYNTKYGEKRVEAATMFDINTAIMRCLTKNLAMFGLGHYIYAGEDLPKELGDEENAQPSAPKKEESAAAAKSALTKEMEDAKHELSLCKDDKSIDEVVKAHKDLWTSQAFKGAVANRRKELLK